MSSDTTHYVTGTPAPADGNPIFRSEPRPKLQHRLSADQIRQYHEDGFIVIRGLLDSAEAEFYGAEANVVVEAVRGLSKTYRLDPMKNMRFELDTETDRVWKVDPFTDMSAVFGALARDRRICDRLAGLYDGHEPRLFKDKLILKPPHSHGNNLHQDHNWWQGFPESCLTVTIALDRTTRVNGCTRLWAVPDRRFFHKTGSLSGQIPESAIAGLPATYLELEPGDAAIFHCLTPHAAEPNNTDHTRCVLFLSYNDSRDGEWRQAHYDHFFWYRTAAMEATRDEYYFL